MNQSQAVALRGCSTSIRQSWHVRRSELLKSTGTRRRPDLTQMSNSESKLSSLEVQCWDLAAGPSNQCRANPVEELSRAAAHSAQRIPFHLGMSDRINRTPCNSILAPWGSILVPGQRSLIAVSTASYFQGRCDSGVERHTMP
jgi:hypothetical protein